MLENFIYALPIWVLICGSLGLWVLQYFNNEQTYSFKLTKTVIILAMLFNVVFYNKSPSIDLLKADSFSFLFQILIYLGSLATLFLSRKWYASMGMAGYSFCLSLMFALIFCNILIMSVNLGLTTFCIIFLMLGNYLLLKEADKNKDIFLSNKIYGVSAIIFAVLMVKICTIFYLENGSLSYQSIANYINIWNDNFIVYAIVCIIVFCFLFLIGLAPFHYWSTENMGQIILPVFTYFSMIPVVAYFAAFIRINLGMFAKIQDSLNILYLGVAILSIFVGALGTCNGQNIRKIFANSTLYHLGVVFLVLQEFSASAINSSFVYLFVYLLAMYGICTALYGIKSKGEYLFLLSDLSGAATKKPYVSFMLSVFLFSLIGFPPFLGFLGIFSVLNELAMNNNLYLIVILFVAMIVVTYSYLQIIKSLYFDKINSVYDRTEMGIYIAILINVAVMVLIMLRPRYLMQDLNIMLEAIFE